VFGTTGQTLSLSANLGSLSGEGEEIVKWVRYRLGEPKLTVELDNLQIYSAFEEANIEYSSIINRFLARNWLSNYLGLNRDFSTQDFTNKLPHQTLDFLMRLANPFASHANVGGIQDPRKAYITTTAGTHDYDIHDFIDNATGSSVDAYITSVGGARADLRTLYHTEPSTVYRYYDPYSSVNILSQEFQYESISNETTFYIMPIWTDILRAGLLETNDRVRRSSHTFNIFGSRVRILPEPAIGLKIWMDYTTSMDPFNPDNSVSGGDPSVTGISSIANIPYTNIKYEDINQSGRRWIRQFTLGVAMETLGRIRRKFSTIPIPGNEATLDGDALVSEGLEKQDQLKESLREELEETSNLALMRQDAEMADNIEQQLSRIPAPVPMIFFG